MKRARFTQKASHDKAERGAISILRKDSLGGGQTLPNTIRNPRGPAAALHGVCPPLKKRTARHHLSFAQRISPKTKTMKFPEAGHQGQAI